MIREISFAGIGGLGSVSIPLGPGLTVITGESGSGKTMVLRAISAVSGAKLDSSLFSRGESDVRIDCIIDLKAAPTLLRRIDHLEPLIDDDELLITRTFESRSRCLVGGRQVPAAFLGELFDEVVLLHTQHDQHALAKVSQQRGLLDRFAGVSHLADVEALGVAYAQLRALNTELALLREQREDAERARGAIEQLLQDVENLQPQRGEVQSLKDDIAELTNAAEHQAAIGVAIAALDGTEDHQGALASLVTATQALERIPGVRDREPVQLLAEAVLTTRAAAEEIRHLLDDAQSLDGLIEQRHQRLRALTDAVRRHAVVDVDALLDLAETSADRADVSQSDRKIAQMSTDVESKQQELLEIAHRVSDQRRASAEHLAREATARLATLGLSHASFDVLVEPTELGVSGIDDVSFRLLLDGGASAVNLDGPVSGGELSRIALALQVVLVDADSRRCLVFDEIDAGVGGVTAHAVGATLTELAKIRQVIVVTHLAQVASLADQHIRVQRTDSGVIVDSLTDSDRVEEVARMVGLVDGLESARAVARDLLAQSRRWEGAVGST